MRSWKWIVAVVQIGAVILSGCGIQTPESQVGIPGITITPPSDSPPAPNSTLDNGAPAEPGETIVPGRLPVIWDDDGSPDGVIALMYLLANPEVDVKALTVSVGEAYPSLFAEKLTGLLAKLGLDQIPVAAGRETPLQGDHSFPESWRQPTNAFWNLPLPAGGKDVEPFPAAQLMVNIIKSSPKPVFIMTSGSLTNLADALRIDPTIAENIAAITTMGGALYVDGNLHEGYPDLENRAAEWNIWIDPIAASEVFSSGIPILLTPLDATNQVLFDLDDTSAWEASGSAPSIVAADLHRWVLQALGLESVYIWDLISAVNLTNPELCGQEAVHVRIVTEQGPEEGRTVVDQGQDPNVMACLHPNADGMKAHIRNVFHSSQPLESSMDQEDISEIGHQFEGTWSGSIESLASDFGAQLIIVITANCEIGDACGTYTLAEYICQGNLILKSKTHDTHVFIEELTSGPDYCLDGDRETLCLLDDGSLDYRFEHGLGDGQTISVGVLMKQ